MEPRKESNRIIWECKRVDGNVFIFRMESLCLSVTEHALSWRSFSPPTDLLNEQPSSWTSHRLKFWEIFSRTTIQHIKLSPSYWDGFVLTLEAILTDQPAGPALELMPTSEQEWSNITTGNISHFLVFLLAQPSQMVCQQWMHSSSMLINHALKSSLSSSISFSLHSYAHPIRR